MSRYIGKRVSYECGFCKKQFTLNKQSVDDSEKSGEVFCSKRCSEQFYLSVVVGRSEQCAHEYKVDDNSDIPFDLICQKCGKKY